MLLNPKLYDRLKIFTMIILPFFLAFYVGFGQIWDLPKTEEVGGSIALLITCLGGILQKSSSDFKSMKEKEAHDPQNIDGYVMPTAPDPDTGIQGMQFTISRHPNDFLNREFAIMKIGPPPAQPTLREPIPDLEPGPRPEV